MYMAGTNTDLLLGTAGRDQLAAAKGTSDALLGSVMEAAAVAREPPRDMLGRMLHFLTQVGGVRERGVDDHTGYTVARTAWHLMNCAVMVMWCVCLVVDVKFVGLASSAFIPSVRWTCRWVAVHKLSCGSCT